MHQYQKARISLLSNAEIEELYGLPTFNKKDRDIFFTLSNSDYKLLNEYRTQKLKIYFILQLGYFRATQQFYNFKFDDVLEDVSYLINKYFTPSQNSFNDKPHRKSIKDQQTIILKLYNYIGWSTNLVPQVIEHLLELIRYYPKGSNALRELFKYFQSKSIVIPKYRTLQDIFSKAFSAEEVRLNKIITSIPENIKQQLQEVANNSESVKQLSIIQCDQKDFQYTAVTLEIKKAQAIEKLYQFCKSFIPQLGISKNSIRYYSELVENYYASRLRKMSEQQQQLYLICFIYNRYQQIMDNLIATFQYHMSVILKGAKDYANDAAVKYSQSLTLDFPKLAQFLKWFPSKEENGDEITYPELTKEAYAILPKAQFALIAAFIEGKTFDKTKAKWEFYRKSFALFSRYLRPVLLNVEFELANQNSYLTELIAYLKRHYSKGKYPSTLKLKISDAKLMPIIKSKIPYLKSDTDSEYIDPYRLEFYIYWKMNNYITKGRLVCNNSVSYADLDNDLISDELVDKVEEISAKFGYNKIPVYSDKRLDEALLALDSAWDNTTANIANGTNKGIEITETTDAEGNIIQSWELLYDPKEKLDDSFFSNLPKIEIANLLKFIGDLTQLWDGFTHIKHRYIKRQKPNILAVIACILARAFGLNIQQMAEICDININILRATDEDFIRVETFLAANDIISNYVHSLPIFKAWNLLDGELLADADGKKHSTNNSTIQSRYSKKYLGNGRGISLYSLMANNVVVNAKSIGLNEYEGHGLYDIICGNTSNIPINYVTGDNHSINPINFVVLDSVDVGYLPSIKNIKHEAEKLCSNKPISEYTGLIKPQTQIDRSLITSNKRWITRVLMSLILQENTQTTIIRKLSSHDRYAKLQNALYEYNKILKSTHVLNMINDLELRKAIKAARNRTEAYHQLQGKIRKVYQGIFKGKKIIDNLISSHSIRLLANCIIAYNSTLLNPIYKKMIDEKAPQSVINEFLRISPIAWCYLTFTGKYSFKKNNSKINLKEALSAIETKIRSTLWKKEKI